MLEKSTILKKNSHRRYCNSKSVKRSWKNTQTNWSFDFYRRRTSSKTLFFSKKWNVQLQNFVARGGRNYLFVKENDISTLVFDDYRFTAKKNISKIQRMYLWIERTLYWYFAQRWNVLALEHRSNWAMSWLPRLSGMWTDALNVKRRNWMDLRKQKLSDRRIACGW
jgi:hypothetical protein